jgi:hypothetical protein
LGRRTDPKEERGENGDIGQDTAHLGQRVRELRSELSRLQDFMENMIQETRITKFVDSISPEALGGEKPRCSNMTGGIS